MNIDNPIPIISTQPQDEIIEEEEDNNNNSNNNRGNEEKKKVVVWGRLVSFHPDSPSLDLVDQEILFGRNRKRCQVVFTDITVSGIHCKIYREVTPKQTAVYVTDFSTNGTFIKGIPLGKDKTTLLQNGDMVSFTSAKINTVLSFIFQDLLSADQDQEDTEIKKHYIIQHILGTGNFSVVKKCIKRDTGDSYAVKIIDKKKYWNTSKNKNQTQSEISILKQIKHPNIISIIEIFDTERYLYIVLELATGGELFDHIKAKGRYSEPEAKIVFKQILEAVSYLHQLNITHRDLKPENILVDKLNNGESIIKITDFGLAKIIGEKEIATTLCGTPLYVAPEIIKNCLYHDGNGNAGYGKEVDAWSLGCILYILLSGRPPFDIEKKQNFHLQIDKGLYSFDFPVWTTVTSNAKDLISKLLNVDPTKRISAKDSLIHPWFTIEPELYRNATVVSSPIKAPYHTQHHVVQLPVDVKNRNIPLALNNSNNSSSSSTVTNNSPSGKRGMLQFESTNSPTSSSSKGKPTLQFSNNNNNHNNNINNNVCNNNNSHNNTLFSKFLQEKQSNSKQPVNNPSNVDTEPETKKRKDTNDHQPDLSKTINNSNSGNSSSSNSKSNPPKKLKS
ncbi:hypothetical protein CYY_003780 [Polysphondylium violaceum]|uniref:non-specific serine/threonine protein kinase n=1 Tax=Polysphondylium violaceum TaxID=133409 RepID=A0A8J4PVQ4_9MYCE|nr:hypothetical protein CYY_003780 [Polysphondylium violaceum]